MTKPSTYGAAFAVAAAALFLSACAKSDRPAAKDSTPVQAVASPAAPDPGALPKPIDQMTGEELYTFTRTLTFTGGVERERLCRGNPRCRGPRPTDSTRLRVDAVQGEDSLSANGLPANGVIGARALNLGTQTDSMYSTRPGRQYEYFLIVASAGPGVASWRLEELDTTQGARAHRRVSIGMFHGCNHPFARGARADFKTCAQAATVRPAAFGMFFQSDGESPLWISCAMGCCTADGTDTKL